jgi:predicted hotdog family 3-hydroxylacyl-ACP dehydratase
MKPCPFPIADMLPHAEPMILLDEALGFDDDRLQAAVTIRPDAPFCRSEGMPAHVAIEYMAQACAAWVGLQALRAGGSPRVGFLLGTRSFRATRPWIANGTRLVVTVAVEFRDETMGVFDCRVEDSGGELASAQLTVHQPAEPQPSEQTRG